MRIWGSTRSGEESLRQPLPVARLVAFALVGLFCLGYLIFSVVGSATFKGQYDVKVDLAETGGLFPGSQVTYRGVPIGLVSSIDIAPDRNGVIANLKIHDDVKVPASTLAVVADRSPAGEQYLDLQPTAAGPPYLSDSSDPIPMSMTRLPPSLAGLLNSVSSFSGSVDIKELRSVFKELNAAFSGTGPALGQIIDNTSELVQTLQSVEPQTIDLLDNAGKLLDTQTAHGADLHRFSVSLRQLADTLRKDDPKTVRLIGAALSTTQAVGPILRRDAGNLSTVLDNLATTGAILNDRLPGFRVLLVQLPRGLGALASGVHGGHVLFKLLTATGTACPYDTRRHTPFDDQKGSPIYNAYCTNPPKGTQVRGARNAPRPPGDDTAGPGSGSSANSSTSAHTGRDPRAHSSGKGNRSWIDVFAAGES